MHSPSSTARAPVLIISMGVSGSGKSTLARHLAKRFGFVFLEADDFHSAENKAHMASGKPLTDAMREPWINSLCEQLRQHRARGESCVLAYSGLRRAHRQRFRELGYPTLFLHLSGSKEVIRKRMASRTRHFMPPGLLDSQYEALEPTAEETDVTAIDIGQNISHIQRQTSQLINEFIASMPR